MGLRLEDGKGGGFQAEIDSKNRLATTAVTEAVDAYINKISGKQWSIPFEDLNPDGNDDYVVYIKNDGDKVLHITDIRISATAATQVELHAVSGTAAGGTNITLVPKTVGSSATAEATIQSGTDITGLTNDGIIFFIQCAVANTEYHLRTSSKIRIPRGQAVALLVETGTANVTGVISIVEEE